MKKLFFPLLLIGTLVVGCGQLTTKSDKTNDENNTEQVQVNASSDNEPVSFIITTKYGVMKGILYNETPIHRDNFIKLTGEGFYDGLLFHRVIQGFMIQGGDPDSKGAATSVVLGNGGPNYTLQAEIMPKFIHKKGALAAARTADNINPNRESSGSQFYIVQGSPITQEMLDKWTEQGQVYTETQMAIYKKLGGSPHLDNQYTVFGEIVDGLNVIDSIATVKTDPYDRPLNNIDMKIEIVNQQ
jgi:peptidyl-prolyl cis-trans isomerase B (cyclophilin B)